ncbi:MAG TPA: hypothetical protein VG604_00910 [Candidatus Saccharimonadales bacterium]|nr:hypothetical protein [Candidatus Saccharimonadales bacterium]
MQETKTPPTEANGGNSIKLPEAVAAPTVPQAAQELGSTALREASMDIARAQHQFEWEAKAELSNLNKGNPFKPNVTARDVMHDEALRENEEINKQDAKAA